ncbi:hypothetical protein CRUP_037526, partial [Coryphaenoides rupestris]
RLCLALRDVTSKATRSPTSQHSDAQPWVRVRVEDMDRGEERRMTRVGKRKKKTKGPDAASKLPLVTPHTQCRLKLLKQERIKDYLLMEEEFIRNQEQMKPLEEKQEVGYKPLEQPSSAGVSNMRPGCQMRPTQTNKFC